MIRATSTRVRESTADDVNQAILHEMELRIRYYAAHKDQIGQRLSELDQEWDIERILEVGVSSATLIGLVMGTFRGRRWFLLPAVVGSFVLYFALQGWAPPVPLLRGMGIRTHSEIDQERYALKVLRGDFQISDIDGKTDLEQATAILRSVTLN